MAGMTASAPHLAVAKAVAHHPHPITEQQRKKPQQVTLMLQGKLLPLTV
jgi:hypothetical protein